ncbi:MAG: type VI secretion system amidase effector protein Tae4 [Paracoccus sp. (in: a-proteobacteria)]|nr:type VI secretion system amidase effector protein Tae4 [Paracoccus sp. (in: a-proteobacteria)]
MSFDIPYATLKANYASSNTAQGNFVSQRDLFTEIGWEEFLGNPNYRNTCAIRLSLAIVKSGREVRLGSHRILKGPHQGKRVEVGMKRLAALLATPAWLGKPETLSARTPVNDLRGRRGIIAFHGIPGFSGGGHIDLIDPAEGCASDCYFGAGELWFWPLAVRVRAVA